jgi:hypothetical protein
VQIALASPICSRDLPDSESGKNNSGSADRQAAADRQLAPVADRAVVAYPETWSSLPTTLLSLVPTLAPSVRLVAMDRTMILAAPLPFRLR